jgi:nicotinamidase/pyrazinamidase
MSFTTDRSQATPGLLVVDVQNDFCPGGALAVPYGDEIVPILNRYLALFANRGFPISFSRDWHPEHSRHFQPFGGRWPAHCVRNTVGAELHPGLSVPAAAELISKGTSEADDGYSAFEGHGATGMGLAEWLVRRCVDTLYVGGLATEYCVRASVLDALRNGFSVVLLVDAVRALDAADGARTIEELRRAGARPETIEDVERALALDARNALHHSPAGG